MPGALNVWAAELPALHARANAAGKKTRPADAEKGVLHKALRAGDVVKCQELLNAGVGANDEEEVQNGMTPLMQAACGYNDNHESIDSAVQMQLVQLLIEHNADIDAQIEETVSILPPSRLSLPMNVACCHNLMHRRESWFSGGHSGAPHG